MVAAGSAGHVAGLSHALTRDGHDVSVYSRREHGPAEAAAPEGYRVVIVSAGQRTRELLSCARRFADALRSRWETERPDLVHAHGSLAGLAAATAAQEAGLPVVQTFPTLATVEGRFKDADHAQLGDRIRAERLVVKRADRVLASCSRQAAELGRLGMPKSRLSLVPLGIDTDIFTPTGKIAERTRRRRVVSVGPLEPRSGFDTAIVALKALPATELVIAGGPRNAPEGKRLRALAARLGVGDRVRFANEVAQGDLPALLRSADVVACTPWHDPSGAGALRAMACGVPVVADAVGGLRDAVVDRETGRLVPPRDPRALAKALKELLADPIARDRYGLAGHDRVHARYSWARVAEDTAHAYDLVLA